MKCIIKSILTICLAAALLMMTAVGTGAVNAYNENDGTDDTKPLTDTASFTFTKHYELAGDTTDGVSPAEDFTVTFTPYSFANVPALANMTTAAMPVIANATLNAAAGAADTNAATNITATVTLPDYAYVGDYWYEVKETAGTTAGVTYDSASYYLHVQVLHAAENSADLIRLVTLHTNAPNADGTPNTALDTKNDGITNAYSNGALSVKKVVEGNMGDLTKEYEVIVTFTYDSADDTNCPVKSVITYTDGEEKTLSGWTYAEGAWTAAATLSLSHNETVTFKNIPYGIAYTVAETDYSADGYAHTFVFANADNADTVIAESAGNWSAAQATGTITDAKDELTVTNEKNSAIDVGVLIENAPFVALIVLAAVAGVILIVFGVRKRRESIDR